MRYLGIAIAWLAHLSFACLPALAQREIPVFRPTGVPVFEKSSSDVPAPSGKAPKLVVPSLDLTAPEAKFLDTYGREHAEQASKWISTINMVWRNYGCTGTMIGPRVMLTAAHCIERFPTIGILISDTPPPRKIIFADCATHRLYRPQGYFNQFDYGLCHLQEAFPDSLVVSTAGEAKGSPAFDFRDVRFERLSLDARHVSPRGLLLLAGYGCSSKRSQKIDGNLRAGLAVVTLVSPLRIGLGGPSRPVSSVLCAGDSGGAAYRYFSKDPYGKRVIVGVNSASILFRDISVLAPTSSPTFAQFLRSWRARWGNPRICGIDGYEAPHCHK